METFRNTCHSSSFIFTILVNVFISSLLRVLIETVVARNGCSSLTKIYAPFIHFASSTSHPRYQPKLNFFLQHSYFLISMSDSTINQVSDSESETLSASRIGTSPDSHIPPLDYDCMEPEVIPLSKDLDSERVYRNSLEERASTSDIIISFVKCRWKGESCRGLDAPSHLKRGGNTS